MTKFPQPLRPGDLIAVTAPSSGVSGAALGRLDLAIGKLRARGYRVVEGDCLRAEYKNASAPTQVRAQELNRFLNDPEVSAIIPPWGGELASEILELLDFQALRHVRPKWLLGFSDTSTLQLPLTLISNWATAHGPNLMDLGVTQQDRLTEATLDILESRTGSLISQSSSDLYQIKWTDFATQVDAPLNLTERTQWKRLDDSDGQLSFAGRLVGGCLDTIVLLAGTRYGDVPSFARQNRGEGTVLFLENVEMGPPALVRALLALKRHGWFRDLTGLLIGRSDGPTPVSPADLGYAEALGAVLGEAEYPVLYDVDIGHRPPQMTLINGAFASVTYINGTGSISFRTEA
jgi:muramoyltetrapeptide carboxypeptidase LdcA involved in peptidoglycan recycling